MAARKWSKEQREKHRATMAAKRQRKLEQGEVKPSKKEPKQHNANVQDAIVYLRHARREIKKSFTKSELEELDPAYLYTLLALKVLEGK